MCACACVCADAGRDVDNKILTHFAAQWAEKKKLNLYESPKAVLRLTAAIDKVKQQLSGYNTSVKLPVNVECLQDDHDFASTLSTEELQAQIKKIKKNKKKYFTSTLSTEGLQAQILKKISMESVCRKIYYGSDFSECECRNSTLISFSVPSSPARRYY